ncbi:TetR/AcrR family transcriptional regulator [Rhodococcus sp. F64268]|uniref:TetR/AcrR family transcriptional regulator n=1 Tax=Rhodococcus sp. F64268 TaxID=2926402 RepID=UPI001FF35423|nr:TetR/AcrR family transcriptional regulator [Rhodococcus sp. F64268]MCK0090135.1 TetR/AcrR family transcriptional regulator [Rhodococcus sp. F64268]
MTTSRGRYSSGERTRIRLIETAEKLFARRGYDGVTLAEIRKAAGQHNSSVIGYYFGTKDGLLDAVADHRFPAVDAGRGALVRRFLQSRHTLSTRDALWAVAEPLANTLGRNNHYVAMLYRLLDEGRLAEHVAAAMATSNGYLADNTLRASAGHLPADVVEQRLDLVYESIVRALSRCDAVGRPPTYAELSALVDAWEAVLVAPLSEETQAAREVR